MARQKKLNSLMKIDKRSGPRLEPWGRRDATLIYYIESHYYLL